MVGSGKQRPQIARHDMETLYNSNVVVVVVVVVVVYVA